jgi:hypothetical protein
MPGNHLARRAIIAYVPQDEEFLPEMEEGLEALCRKRLLTSWKPYHVGGEQDPLLDSDILLLLISPCFVESRFFSQGETDLLKKHEARELCVIPVLVRYTFWPDRPLAALKALPPDGCGGVQPFGEGKRRKRNRELALEQIKEGVITIVDQFEQEQLAHMSLLMQAVGDVIEQGWSEQMMERGLLEQFFVICERLGQGAPEVILPVLDQLANLADEDQPELSVRCSEKAAAIRQELSEPS